MKLKVHIENTRETLKIFKEFGEEGEKMFKEKTLEAAMEIADSAKDNASFLDIHDNGHLISGIQFFGDGLYYNIVAEEPYSAYHEFGTGGMVEIPKDWGEYASEFLGAGIKEVNIPARPFMYPAFMEGSRDYLTELGKALYKLTDKYNK